MHWYSATVNQPRGRIHVYVVIGPLWILIRLRIHLGRGGACMKRIKLDRGLAFFAIRFLLPLNSNRLMERGFLSGRHQED